MRSHFSNFLWCKIIKILKLSKRYIFKLLTIQSSQLPQPKPSSSFDGRLRSKAKPEHVPTGRIKSAPFQLPQLPRQSVHHAVKVWHQPTEVVLRHGVLAKVHTDDTSPAVLGQVGQRVRNPLRPVATLLPAVDHDREFILVRTAITFHEEDVLVWRWRNTVRIWSKKRTQILTSRNLNFKK